MSFASCDCNIGCVNGFSEGIEFSCREFNWREVESCFETQLCKRGLLLNTKAAIHYAQATASPPQFTARRPSCAAHQGKETSSPAARALIASRSRTTTPACPPTPGPRSLPHLHLQHTTAPAASAILESLLTTLPSASNSRKLFYLANRSDSSDSAPRRCSDSEERGSPLTNYCCLDRDTELRTDSDR